MSEPEFIRLKDHRMGKILQSCNPENDIQTREIGKMSEPGFIRLKDCRIGKILQSCNPVNCSQTREIGEDV